MKERNVLEIVTRCPFLHSKLIRWVCNKIDFIFVLFGGRIGSHYTNIRVDMVLDVVSYEKDDASEVSCVE